MVNVLCLSTIIVIILITALANRHVSLLYCQLQGHMMSCDPPTTEEERESCVLSLSLIARHLLNMVCQPSISYTTIISGFHTEKGVQTNVPLYFAHFVCFPHIMVCLHACMYVLAVFTSAFSGMPVYWSSQGEYEVVKALFRSSKRLLKTKGKSYKV